jgi:hypothetical protein
VQIGREGENFLVGVQQVLIAGGQEPSQKALADLQPYTLHDLRPYDPRYLANWSAGLYTRDAIDASITASAFMKYWALRSGGLLPPSTALFVRTDWGFSGEVPLGDLAQMVGTLEYRLLLLPAWMVTLTLRDGRTHRAMINAQSGEVVFAQQLHSHSHYQQQKPEPVENVIRPIAPPPSVIRPLQPIIHPLPPRR